MTKKSTYTEAQKRADLKWAKQNREHRRYLTRRSTSRSFIRDRATLEDLDELEQLIINKRKELKKL